jgi:virginiamycin B lyase
MIGTRVWRLVFMALGVTAISAAFVLLLGGLAPATAGAVIAPEANSAGESFVYRFDPHTSRFVFTFTIPTDHANPWDVALVPEAGHVDVWFTEPGADQIGRLTYTDTNDYTPHEYALAAGSHPLNLVAGGGFIWFTAADGDYIGRLDPATWQIDEFPVTAGSYPADLDYASDGSIWFTEMAADRVGHLVVDHTDAYTVTEHASPITGAGEGRPYGIVWVSGSVYFAHPRTGADTVTRFTPPDSWVDITGFQPGIPDKPYKLAATSSGLVWATERAGNGVTSFEIGTMPVVNRYSLTPTGSLPTGLAADANDYLWFTQWRAGQIGQLRPSISAEPDYYPMPLSNVAPAGIATDDVWGVWVVAAIPHHVHLPIIVRSS